MTKSLTQSSKGSIGSKRDWNRRKLIIQNTCVVLKYTVKTVLGRNRCAPEGKCMAVQQVGQLPSRPLGTAEIRSHVYTRLFG